MTDDDVELVARAIAAVQCGIGPNIDGTPATGIRLPDDLWRQAIPHAERVSAALRAAGWQKVPDDCVVVPREPTSRQHEVGKDALDWWESRLRQEPLPRRSSWDTIYCAMIEAAKEP